MKKLINIELLLLVVGGVVLWNTWIFGWLNHGIAGYTQMSISDLNVGQPWSRFFSCTEGLSGLFMLVGATGLIVAIRRGVFLLLSLLVIAVIGAFTVFDATHPVDCNPYHNPVCVAQQQRGQISKTQREHGIESILSDYATVSLGAVLVLWVFVHKLTGEDVAIAEIVAVLLLAFGVLWTRLFHVHNPAIGALIQRLWNTLVSFEFLYVAYKARQFVRHREGSVS